MNPLNPHNIVLKLPDPTPPPNTPHPIHRCPTCTRERGDAAYCAPLRCYCLHNDCPAKRTPR